MTVSDESKKKFLLNVAYIAVIVALVYVALKYCAAWLMPFIIGFCFAALANWLSRKLLSKIKFPHKLGSVILNIIVLVLVGFAVYFICFQVYRLIRGFIQTFVIEGDLIAQATAALKSLADKLPGNLGGSLSGILDKLPATLATPITSFVTKTVTDSAPGFLVGFLISIIASFIITADYDHIRAFIVNQFSGKGKKLLSELRTVMTGSVLKLLRSYLLIILITFSELFIGFTILKLCSLTTFSSGSLAAIAAITAIIDIIPVFGTGFVLWPWALISAINGQYAFAAGLIVIYVIIQVIRQIIEPRLVGDSLGLHPIVALTAMYVGVTLFGVGGIFVLPLGLFILKALQERDYIKFYKPLAATPKKRKFTAKTADSEDRKIED